MKNYKIISSFVFLTCLTVTAYLFYASRDVHELQLSRYFSTIARLHLDALKSKLEGVEDICNDLQAFYGSSTYVDRKEFHDFLRLLPEETKDVHYSAWFPKVTSENFDKLLEEAKKDGLENFVFQGKTAQKTPFFPLYFGFAPEKLEAAEPLFGKSFSDDPKTSALFDKYALDLEAHFLVPNDIISGLGTSFWAYLPVYKEGKNIPENHLGFAGALFSIEKLLNEIDLDKKTRDDVVVELYEKTDTSKKLLFAENKQAFADVDAGLKFAREIDVEWANVNWVVRATPSSVFGADQSAWLSYVLLLIGVMLSIVFARFTYFHARRTEEAIANNKRLQQHIIERQQLEDERLDFERRSAQTNKLESLGTLAAGIAHEINTPVQYVNDNVEFLSKSTHGVLSVLNDLQEKLGQNGQVQELYGLMPKADLDFLVTEVPESIKAAQEGIARVKEIVKAVKDFSRPPSVTKSFEDINNALLGTLVIARNHWKDKCNIVKNFAQDLPAVPCNLGEVNQVFLNLIVNAIDATADNPQSRPPEITLSTHLCGKNVCITVEDNGPGIPADIQKKIFDPFFTTKDPGKGTGQGLAISRMIIVKNHSGTLELDKTKAHTCFVICLPVQIGEVKNDAKDINSR